MRTHKGTPKGFKWPSVAMLLLLRKKRGKRPGMRRTYFRSRDFVTSCQKAALGRIWRNFRLRMRRIYFRTWHLTDVTSCHVTDVTSGHVNFGHAQWSYPPHDPPQMWLELYPYTTPITTKVVSWSPAHGDRDIFDTTCDKVFQWLAACGWFSLVTLVSSTIKLTSKI
jgi:hypothetical protein